MEQGTPEQPGMRAQSAGRVLEELAREGARRMLAQALEVEIQQYLEQHQGKNDGQGRRLAVRNGRMPERAIASGIGPLVIKQLRVDDCRLREAGEEGFTSQILPRYLQAGAEHRQPDSGAVPGWDPHRGFLRGAGGHPGTWSPGALGDQHRAAESPPGTRVPGVEPTGLERQRVRLLWVDGIYVNGKTG